MAEELRLNKAIADAGLCSRRKADELIFAGRVSVNGQKEENPGSRVGPDDEIFVDGKILRRKQEDAAPVWLMLHKPVGVVSTASDPQGRPTVLGFVPEKYRKKRLYPVGRLDFFSEGLLLLSDDGELAHRLTHPRWHLPKVYEVRVRPPQGMSRVPDEVLQTFRKGMTLAEGEELAPVEVSVEADPGRGVLLRMTLHQGLNRQIRRMCRDTGLTILTLKRVSQGPLFLGDLPSGQARELEAAELAALRSAVGLGRTAS